MCRLIGLEDLYDMTLNSDCLAALEDQTVILELAEDLSGMKLNCYKFSLMSYFNETVWTHKLITKIKILVVL